MRQIGVKQGLLQLANADTGLLAATALERGRDTIEQVLASSATRVLNIELEQCIHSLAGHAVTAHLIAESMLTALEHSMLLARGLEETVEVLIEYCQTGYCSMDAAGLGSPGWLHS